MTTKIKILTGNVYDSDNPINIYIPGDRTDKAIVFQVKAENNQFSEILLEKKTTGAGGGDDELKFISVTDDISLFELYLDEADTDSWEAGKYFFELEEDEKYSLLKGEFNVSIGMISNLAGTPQELQRFTKIIVIDSDAEAADNSFLVSEDGAYVKKTLAEVLVILGVSNYIEKSIVNSKGDIVIGFANATPGVLPPGSNGYFPIMDSAEERGMKYTNVIDGGIFT